jgi:hypothetical protein
MHVTFHAKLCNRLLLEFILRCYFKKFIITVLNLWRKLPAYYRHSNLGCLHTFTSHGSFTACIEIIYKTIILSVALYGCETWSMTLREDHRLTVFENRVLRRIFGPNRDEVI